MTTTAPARSISGTGRTGDRDRTDGTSGTTGAPAPRGKRPRRPDRPDRTRGGRLPRRARDGAALTTLLAATGALYLWDLGASGWANSFYAAAAQAGSESWRAFFFGASDAAGSITVDKPPLALWPMGLSVRLFGLSSWSILVPQALMGVASVAVLHATVRRATGSTAAGLLAGAALATTPVAALMFRFDNPDALLVLLMTGAAACVLRALESPRAVRWLACGGALLGLAFLTKTLQAFLVVPGFALTYAIFARVPWRTRLGQLAAAAGAMVLAGGWWVAIVEIWPAGSRPYIGGSQDDDFLSLTFGYNGFGRLTGDETGSVGGGNGWGGTGVWRLFGSDNGTQAGWLIPAALVLGVAALVWGSRRTRAAATLFLGWLVVTAATFSFMSGIYHAYYTVALAPAIGALVGLGAIAAWRRRDLLPASALLGLVTALTAAFASSLLQRTPDYHPWLRHTIVVGGCAAALMIAGVRHLPPRVASVVAAAALLAGLSAPAAYAVSTAATPHTGSIPSAGPTSGSAGPSAMGGLLEASSPGSDLVALLDADADSFTWVAATVGSNTASGYQLATQHSVMPLGGFNGSDPSPTLAQFQQWVAEGRIHYFIAGGGGLFGGGGGLGGMFAGAFANVFGGVSVGGSQGASEVASITSWVSDDFTPGTVDGVTVYDLTQPTSAGSTPSSGSDASSSRSTSSEAGNPGSSPLKRG